MNNGAAIFFGLFVTMACSWLGFILGPQLQLGDLQPTTTVVVGGNGANYPHNVPGAAHQGAEIYRANGCAACHTQQIRPSELGADIHRGWGVRRSTAYDYLFTEPVMLGSLRVGPDLANASRRTDAMAVLTRLYEPRAITPGSIMPSYRYLFDVRKIKGEPSTNAVQVRPEFAAPEGYEIMPRPAALALAAYIMSLHQNDYLYIAPPPLALVAAAKTNAPATNAPATNAPPAK